MNSYVEKCFGTIADWAGTKGSKGNKVFVGHTEFTPFTKDRYNKTYRLIIRKRKSKNGQTDLFTKDDHEYGAIITNNKEKIPVEIYHFYNQRGPWKSSSIS